MLQNGAYCVGGRQVRQHPAPASTPGTGEDIQRFASCAAASRKSTRGVRCFFGSLLTAVSGASLAPSSPAWGSYGESIRGYGTWGRARIHRLDPSTLLGTLKVSGLQSNYVPSNGGAGMSSVITLGVLTLHTGYLEVNGSFTGNSITEDPRPLPGRTRPCKGNRFVAIYPDFFSQAPQSPRRVRGAPRSSRPERRGRRLRAEGGQVALAAPPCGGARTVAVL